MVQVLENARATRRPYPVMIPRTMSDLLQKVAQSRDVEAFRKLFELYGPRVKSYMMRQGADSTTAEDLAQETLLTVWRKAQLYSDEKGSATTWIFTIARNLRIEAAELVEDQSRVGMLRGQALKPVVSRLPFLNVGAGCLGVAADPPQAPRYRVAG